MFHGTLQGPGTLTIGVGCAVSGWRNFPLAAGSTGTATTHLVGIAGAREVPAVRGRGKGRNGWQNEFVSATDDIRPMPFDVVAAVVAAYRSAVSIAASLFTRAG
jgi:hypothetical protein